MTSPLSTGNRWAVLGVALALLGLGAVVADQAPAAVLINESPSLPRGLYLRAPGAEPGRGRIVAASPPIAARAYLARLGMPVDGLLLKRVAARGGDAVCRRRDGVATPGREVTVRRRDRRGAPLPQWRGCRRLGRAELFLLGDTPDSFDSRYFGPVDAAAIEGVFTEVATW